MKPDVPRGSIRSSSASSAASDVLRHCGRRGLNYRLAKYLPVGSGTTYANWRPLSSETARQNVANVRLGSGPGLAG
jgi:hypothetical protein